MSQSPTPAQDGSISEVAKVAVEKLLRVFTEEEFLRFSVKLELGQQAAIDGKCEQVVGVRFNERGTPTHFKSTADEKTSVRIYKAE